MKKLLLAFLFLPMIALAQTDSTDIDLEMMDLEELMQMKVVVASKVEEDIRDAASIVSVISDQDIKRSGARDLIDALQLLPGIYFNSDVQGIIGIGMRGNWGHEGKVLMLIDGQETNELLYSTTYFGNRVDVTQIKRIEVLRGPGSSVYGGNAELGVINIITKSGEDLNGIQVSGTYGQMPTTTGRANIGLSAGTKKGDLDMSIKGFYGHGQRSDVMYNDMYGNSVSMKGNSTINPFNVNAGLKYKNLSLRIIHENYNTKTVVWYDEALSSPTNLDFRSTFGELKYDFKPSEKLKITPKLNGIIQNPWKTDEANSYYNVQAQKLTGGLHTEYKPIEEVNIQAGIEYFNESGKNLISDYTPYFFIGDDTIGSDVASFHTLSGYAQVVAKTDVINITGGVKYIDHNLFGSAWAPRLALTKTIDKFHFKALFNKAFRAPAIENFGYNSEIQPEKTTVYELETGYQLKKNMRVSANIFDITIKDPIVYYYDVDLGGENYDNFSRTGSRGVELEYKLEGKKGSISTNYTYYTNANKDSVDLYISPLNNRENLGFPQHKFALLSRIKINDDISFNPSAVFYSPRFEFTSIDSLDNLNGANVSSNLLFNANFRYANFLVDGLDLNLAVFDLLNTRYRFMQPYQSTIAPIPSSGREIVLRLTYSYSKKKTTSQ